MRGYLKNDSYFLEKLSKNDVEVENYESLVNRVLAEKGENDRGVQMGFAILNATYKKRINLLYTVGTRDDEIKVNYERWLRYYARTWRPEDDYFALIKVLSLAILLDVSSSNESMSELEEKIKKSGINDYLIDLFLSKIDNKWKRNAQTFIWEDTYQPLKEVAECSNGSEALSKLKTYLSDQWYDIHDECEWYDSHKTSAFYGYWSFEAAALVKILNLDDKTLQNQDYYPYDLVHKSGECNG